MKSMWLKNDKLFHPTFQLAVPRAHLCVLGRRCCVKGLGRHLTRKYLTWSRSGITRLLSSDLSFLGPLLEDSSGKIIFRRKRGRR